jgi:type I restriction enzyme S subunit
MSALPGTWAEATIDDLRAAAPNAITDGPYGSVLKTSHYRPQGARVIRLGNIGSREFLDNDVAYISLSHFAVLAKHHVAPGDVIIAALGDPVGRACLAPPNLGPALVKADCFRVRTSSQVSATYLMLWLNSGGARVVFSQSAHGMGRVRINLSDLRSTAVPVAPHPEQQCIVAKIDSLSTKSKRAGDQLDRVHRLVEKYKQAILAAAFRGDLTREWRTRSPAEIWSQQQLGQLKDRRKRYLEQRRGSRLIPSLGKLDELSPLPNGWFSAILADMGNLQVGYAYKSKWYSKEGVRLLRGANIAPGRVTWDEEVRLPPKLAGHYSEYALNVGDIVIAMDRPIISTGLKVARITEGDAASLLVQRVARYVPSEFADGTFVWHFIKSQFFIDHAVSQSMGSDLPHISSNDILTTPFPLPVLAEQREIVRCIEAALTWIGRLSAEAANARKLIDHLDQAVLTKAFQGELVPQNSNDEPASVLLERIRAEREAMPTLHGRNGKKNKASQIAKKPKRRGRKP